MEVGSLSFVGDGGGGKDEPAAAAIGPVMAGVCCISGDAIALEPLTDMAEGGVMGLARMPGAGGTGTRGSDAPSYASEGGSV